MYYYSRFLQTWDARISRCLNKPIRVLQKWSPAGWNLWEKHLQHQTMPTGPEHRLVGSCPISAPFVFGALPLSPLTAWMIKGIAVVLWNRASLWDKDQWLNPQTHERRGVFLEKAPSMKIYMPLGGTRMHVHTRAQPMLGGFVVSFFMVA